MDKKPLPRSIARYIQMDLKSKLILLSGPRQSGKTTLSRALLPEALYLNYDSNEHRMRILRADWPKDIPAIILDEVHKMKNWKRWLKGVYDTKPQHLQILVTGSARMDVAKKMGDSLAGRHFSYRLYPWDLAELHQCGIQADPTDLWKYGNFPEPFSHSNPGFSEKWRRSHSELILRQDLFSIEPIRDIEGIETLIHLLRERVGSPISFASLARDLQRDATTVKRWIGILERLYLIFVITPWSKNIARSILKEPKIYFFDTGMVKGNDSAKFENLVAFSLFKQCHLLMDTQGIPASLHFLKIKGGKEIDFLLQIQDRPPELIEVKWDDSNLSDQFRAFERFFPKAKMTQISYVLSRKIVEFADQMTVVRGADWLRGLSPT